MKVKELNTYGLSDDISQLLMKVFREMKSVRKVVIFGSRAMGTHHSGSDIDLCVFGDAGLNGDLDQLKLLIEDLNLLYEVDLLNFESIDNENLKDHILRIGKIFYGQ